MGLKLKLTTSTGGSMRDTYLGQATNKALWNVIDQLYRPKATEGDGGTADAIRVQIATGKLIGGRDHIQKGLQRIKNLERILKEQNLSSSERELAQKLLDDLRRALEGI